MFDFYFDFQHNGLVKNKGFTLMELLIVISLIMILSSVGVGTYLSATTKSKDTQRKNDLNQIAKAVESFYNDVNRYPLSKPGEDYLHCYVKSGSTVTDSDCIGDRLYAIVDNLNTYYIDIPEDPEPSQKYVYISDGTVFELYAALENSGDNDLLRDVDGNLIVDPWGVSCGSVPCNYKITETGRVKSI